VFQFNDTLRSGLDAARKELLDLGSHNPLLSYRPLKNRGLEIVEAAPAEIVRLLIQEKQPLAFISGEDSLLSQPGQEHREVSEARQAVFELKTKHSSSQLQSRLLRTYETAQTFLEEQGANFLFLAIGMLDWHEEPENKQERRRAPLVLIPVYLARAEAQASFHLRHTEEAVCENLCLRLKLKEFGDTLPNLPDRENLEIERYFDEVSEALKDRPGWSVDRNAIVLAFFPLKNILIYRDLEAWASLADSSSSEPSVKALLQDSFREKDAARTENDQIDNLVSSSDLKLVMDADGDQTLAILDAMQGRSMVIDGPPGTGKSQTITNLIAAAAGNGKKVLFVSEKMAALEAVKRNLDKIGLGDLCLELHRPKTNSELVLKELARTQQLGEPRPRQLEKEIDILNRMRDRLNAYCVAMNTPIRESGVTPHQALGELMRIRQLHPIEAFPKLESEGLPFWNGEELQRRHALVEKLQAQLAQTNGAVGVPKEHAFWGSRLTEFSSADQDRLRDLLQKAKASTALLRTAVQKLTETLLLPVVDTKNEVEQLCRIARTTVEAPDLQGVNLHAEEWVTQLDDIYKLLLTGMKINEIYNNYHGIFIPEAWKEKWGATRKSLEAFGDKWWRLISRHYRQANKHFLRHCSQQMPMELRKKIELIDAIMDAQRQTKVFRAHEHLGEWLFGGKWQRGDSDWNTLTELVQWLNALHHDINNGNLPKEILTTLASHYPKEELQQSLAHVQETLAKQAEDLQAVWDFLKLDHLDSGARDQSFASQEETTAVWMEKIDTLPALVDYNRMQNACREEHLEQVVEIAGTWPEAGHHLVAAFQWARFNALLQLACRERAALRDFDGESHQQTLQKFRELDVLQLEHNRARVAHSHWQKAPKHGTEGQLGVLNQALQEKAPPQIPISELMRKAGCPIQSLKPVFMMSPYAVARYLPPESVRFDLIIFDEASQIGSFDAFGAILRGQQAVVVGDRQQLPSTNLFAHLTGENGENEGHEKNKTESILDWFLAHGAPVRRLRTHYRSRHESLIELSNRLFYDDRVIVFPRAEPCRRAHAEPAGEEFGWRYHHLPETAYEGEQAQCNPEEAEAVAKAVMEHARRHPHLTLGVVTLSMPQMQAIQDQLEQQRRQDSSCESFFSSHQHEPFFVKNIEAAQADARDVIFISIGYGRDQAGGRTENFGPLNDDAGDRYLNVLMTRSRNRCEVFTNLKIEDLDPAPTESRGLKALKTFLEYAQNGSVEKATADQKTGAPFQITIAKSLQTLGYEVKPCVGAAGSFVDLVVVDPDQPGRNLLGIASDTATYHNMRSARERDRLHPQILEGLGWKIHRVWSLAWLNHPERELQRAVEAIEKAKHPIDDARQSMKLSKYTARIERYAYDETALRARVKEFPPYTLATLQFAMNGQGLSKMPADALAALISQIVQVEGPVHITEVTRRLVSAAGKARAGSRIQAAVTEACEHAIGAGTIKRIGDFLWESAMKRPVPRDRSAVESHLRKFDLIAPEEIASAALKVVADAFGIEPDKITPAVCRLLGFPRMTEEMKKQVDSSVDEMIEKKLLARQGEYMVVSE
jgi:hypothetical protein